MTGPTLLLVVLNFAAIGLLTATFFRRDFRIGPKWAATALPHVACPLFLIAAHTAGLAPIVPEAWLPPLRLATVALCVTSIALMFFALGTHRVPLAHFHQDDDVPEHIVTEGPYRRVRHPFYSSYLVLYLAAVTCFPHWVTAGFLAYMAVVLNLTAAGEERRLAASRFGAEYRRYMAGTGRFLPRFASRRVAAPGTTPGSARPGPGRAAPG